MDQIVVLDFFGAVAKNPHFLSFYLVPGLRKRKEYKKIRKIYDKLCEGKATEDEFRKVFESLTKENFQRALSRAFSKISEDIDNEIFELKKKGYELYVYSHFYSPWMHAVLKRAKLNSFFKKVFVTDVIGKRKENGFATVFSFVRKTDKEKYIIYIDDDAKQVKAAKKAGANLAIMKISEPKRISEINGDFVISKLTDIFSVLGNGKLHDRKRN